METQLEKNKIVVKRFNKEIIEEGNAASVKELMNDDFINHTALPGMSNATDGMTTMFAMMRSAFADLKVTVYEQIAEGDLVTTRKEITGTHTGNFMGIPPTGKQITIRVIDIVKIQNGKYAEHWGVNTMSSVMAELSKKDLK